MFYFWPLFRLVVVVRKGSALLYMKSSMEPSSGSFSMNHRLLSSTLGCVNCQMPAWATVVCALHGFEIT